MSDMSKVIGPLRKIYRYLRIPKEIKKRDQEIGEFLLGALREYSLHMNGIIEDSLLDFIRRGKISRATKSALQLLIAACSADYKHNLFQFYEEFQWVIFLSLLTKPFSYPGTLSVYIDPYLDALKYLGDIRVVDYGAGIPFGAIYMLMTYPRKVASVTIVDLDIAHTNFVHFVLTHFFDVEVSVYKVRDASEVPTLSPKVFNMIYGKDVFEHLPDPERVLRQLLSCADRSCVCYLDLRNHTPGVQHVTPHLSHLEGLLSQFSFQQQGRVHSLIKFVRSPA